MSAALKLQPKIYKQLPELKDLEDVMDRLKEFARIETLAMIPYKGMEFPIHSISIGSENPAAPCLLLVGGVHGLERIGTQVINSVLSSMTRALSWDESFQEQMKHCRIVFVPLLNPVGMYRLSRSNGNGVDLMRNAPVDSDERKQAFYGGHRMSPKLPFYRGPQDSPMEMENQVLWDLVKKEVFPSKMSIALDVHSGFGFRDRIWFPYARTRTPFPYLAQMHALKELFDETYQHHVYTIEPQAQQYTTHGDVWDYFFDEFLKVQKDQFFLPLALEMGSWIWIRKNPLQLLNPLGIFNPMAPHRVRRMLRRHKNLVDFLRRAMMSPKTWVHLSPEEKLYQRNKAIELWYPGNKK
jgi:hypothetical protein